MKSLAGGKEDTVTGFLAEGEVSSSSTVENRMASGSSLVRGNGSHDTQVGTAVRKMWA